MSRVLDRVSRVFNRLSRLFDRMSRAFDRVSRVFDQASRSLDRMGCVFGSGQVASLAAHVRLNRPPSDRVDAGRCRLHADFPVLHGS